VTKTRDQNVIKNKFHAPEICGAQQLGPRGLSILIFLAPLAEARVMSGDDENKSIWYIR